MVVISPASSESAVPADMEEIAEEDYNEDTDESVDDGESHTPAYLYSIFVRCVCGVSVVVVVVVCIYGESKLKQLES